MPAASLLLLTVCAVGRPDVSETFHTLTAVRGPFNGAERSMGSALSLVSGGRAIYEVRVPRDASEVVRSGVDLLCRVVEANSGASLPVRDALFPISGRTAIVPIVGDQAAAFPGLRTDSQVGPQGFVIQRLGAPSADRIVIWSPTPVGCRYGIVELLRSLEFTEGGCATRLERVVARPFFPVRIYYLNFGEHLQNAYNANVLYDTELNRWTLADWQRLVDMLAAMRYNVFAFWLVPTLFDTPALAGGELQERYAETMRDVIRYAHSRGVLVEMLNIANVTGPDWRYWCPHIPEEKETILRLWEHWTRVLEGLDIVGLFPGDPGGCNTNGCDFGTCVDLYREIIERTQPNGPFIYEVNTWGPPFFGWGIDGWNGGPDRAREAFAYLERELPSFPQEAYVAICMGLNPDADGDALGGGAEPYVRAVSAIRPVTTWDYGTSEGEGTVIPRYRVPRIIERRRKEATWGYVGGINYTMTPALNQLQAFATAECYWDPRHSAEEILDSYSRLAFGPRNGSLARLVFPYTEVVPDWGGGGWTGDLVTLAAELEGARSALFSASVPNETPLSLFPSAREAYLNLRWHVEVLSRLSSAGADVEEARRLIAALGGPSDGATIEDADDAVATAAPGRERERLAELVATIRAADLSKLRRRYWDHIYGIYDHIRRPVDPRSWGATESLFGRFHAEFVIHGQPSRLERLLRARGTPYLNLDLGYARSESGWVLSGWTVADELDGETWRASFDQPGVAARAEFRDGGYRYVVIRITDDTVGGRKSVWVNGVCVGTYIRPGARLEWTTQQYALPEGLVHDGTLEIRFTEPGVAISDVALSAEPLSSEEIAAPGSG